MGVGAHDGRGCGAGTMRVKGMLAGAGRQGGVCSKGAWAEGSSGGDLGGQVQRSVRLDGMLIQPWSFDRPGHCPSAVRCDGRLAAAGAEALGLQAV